MKSILLSIRDFNFIGYARKGYSEEKAYKEARQSVIAWLIGWYLALLVAIFGIAHELGVRLIPKLERNFFNGTLVGLLAFAPYVVIMWQVTRSLNDIPADTSASYKRLARRAIGVSLTGMAMFLLLLVILSVF